MHGIGGRTIKNPRWVLKVSRKYTFENISATLFEKFMARFEIGEDEEFTFNGDEHKYKIRNNELMIYCRAQNKWCYAGEDTKRYIIDKILLSETHSRKLF